MKVHCVCGRIITDGTDYLPWKGRILPDINADDPFDIVDGLLDEIRKGREIVEGDYMKLRQEFPLGRLIYQCSGCARLLIWDREAQKYHVFQPEDADTPSDLLRGTPRKKV